MTRVLAVAGHVPVPGTAPIAARKRSPRSCSLIVVIAAPFLLGGCGADTAAPGGAPDGSLFARRNIRVQAMLKRQDGTPGPVMIEIHGSPVSIVYPLVEQARAKHRADAEELGKRIVALEDDVVREETRLKEVTAAVSVEYNHMVPEPSEATAPGARNALKHLVKERAQKDDADDWLRKAHAERVAPVKGLITSLESQAVEMQANLTAHRANLPNVLFAALPATPHTWKTDKNGEETISIPPGEPWCFWATYRLGPQRVRWIQDSSDADANGKLSFDETNAFDGALALPSSLNSAFRPD